MELIENKDRRFGSSRCYYRVKIGDDMYLFTSIELALARKRAKTNPEDIKSEKSWWRRLFGL